MLLALLVAASVLALGIGLVSLVDSPLRQWLSPVFGVVAYAWLSYAASMAIGFNALEIALVSIISIAVGVLLFRQKPFVFAFSKADVVALLLCLVVVGGAVFFSVRYAGDGSLVGFPTDFSFHASFVSTIAAGNFPPQYPFYPPGESLSYYWFPHFLAAHFVVGGLGVVSSFAFFAFFAGYFVFLLFLLGRELGGSAKAGACSVVAFLGFSSLALIPYLQANAPSGIAAIISRPEVAVSTLVYEQGYPLVNLFAQYLLYQRSASVGLAIIAVALLLVVSKNSGKRKFVAAGLLLGLAMPFHALLAIPSVILALGFLLLSRRNVDAFYFGVPAVFATGVCGVLFFLPKASAAASGFHYAWGWLAVDKSVVGVAAFWLSNLLFFIIPLLAFRRQYDSRRRDLVIAALPLLLIVNFIAFTPNPWDSSKFLLPAILVFSAVSGGFLANNFNGGVLRRVILVVFLFSALAFSALVFKTIADHGSDVIFSAGEVAACSFVSASTPATALFLTRNDENCISALGGRRVFLSQSRQLGPNALDVAGPLALQKQLLAGNCTLWRSYGVTHYYGGGSQAFSDSLNQSFLTNPANLLYSGGSDSVYRVFCPN